MTYLAYLVWDFQNILVIFKGTKRNTYYSFINILTYLLRKKNHIKQQVLIIDEILSEYVLPHWLVDCKAVMLVGMIFLFIFYFYILEPTFLLHKNNIGKAISED